MFCSNVATTMRKRQWILEKAQKKRRNQGGIARTVNIISVTSIDCRCEPRIQVATPRTALIWKGAFSCKHKMFSYAMNEGNVSLFSNQHNGHGQMNLLYFTFTIDASRTNVTQPHIGKQVWFNCLTSFFTITSKEEH